MSTLRLPATMESFGPLRSFVLQQMELESDLVALVPQVDLVIEEVLVNAIKYAYPQDGGEIEVECAIDGPGRFRVTVRDWGVPFNPLEHAAPDLSADISSRKVGGMGIYLARQMASRLAYEFSKGGNVLTLWFEKEPGPGD